MKTLYNRKHGGAEGERRSFAFFAVGGLAVLAAVFLIGLQVGRYVEKSAVSREDRAGKPGPDNGSEIRKDLGAFAEEAAGVRPVPPPDADNGVKQTEKSVTFPETLARKDPGPVPLVAPGGKTGRAGTPPEAGAAARREKPFLLQTGVFRSKDTARQLKARLSKSGYPAKIVESRGKKGALFRVLVGPYAKDAAVKTKRKLKAGMKIDAVLVRG